MTAAEPEENASGIEDSLCNICFEVLSECDDETHLLQPPPSAKGMCVLCNKMYHDKCIQKWLRKNPNCPLCQQPWQGEIEAQNNAISSSGDDTRVSDVSGSITGSVLDTGLGYAINQCVKIIFIFDDNQFHNQLALTCMNDLHFRSEVVDNGNLDLSSASHRGLQLQGSITLNDRTIPDFITLIDLSNNHFSGSVDLAHLPSQLKELSLHGNQFDGTVNLDSLPNQLEVLRLDNNQFIGSIATCNLPDTLRIFTIASGNQFDKACISNAFGQKCYANALHCDIFENLGALNAEFEQYQSTASPQSVTTQVAVSVTTAQPKEDTSCRCCALW